MKKQYRQAIEKLFSEALEKVGFFLEKIPREISCRYDGEVFFEKKLEKISLIVSVIPNPKGTEEFTVEIGWSKKRRFPDLPGRPSISFPSDDGKEFEKDEGLLRLNCFLKSNSFGWRFRGMESNFSKKYFNNPEALRTFSKEQVEADFKKLPSAVEANEAVRQAVTQSIAALHQFGLPYLERGMSRMNAV